MIPDNHVRRATVSSVATTHEVDLTGGRSIACLNARDRNMLGFRRDLLTASAYGVDEFLFVYGDEPVATGATVSSMNRPFTQHVKSHHRLTPWPEPRCQA